MIARLASRAAAASILALAASVPLAHAQQLTSDDLANVKARLAQGATHSWEIGTRAQALTEFDSPSYSVLNDSSLPPLQGSAPSSLDEVVSIARSVVQNLTNVGQGAQPLIGGTTSGEAAGDPASIGVAVLLANWTGAGAADKLDYAGAARDQLEYLLEKVPRTSDGAISHRVENVQLWADFVYMVPPFLAYYGVLTRNQTLVQAAYDQCRLYREALVDTDAGGMWRHIAGNDSDTGHWTTGNGWAAAGMLRVLGTIQHSQYSKSMKSQAKDLAGWVSQIHNGIYPHLQTTGLFKNYADDSTSFDDASGTAILASTVYRLALLSGVHTNVPNAEKSRIALFAPSASSPSSSSSSSLSSSSSSPSSSHASSGTSSSTAPSSSATSPSLAHFTSDGWLTPVVNPYNVGAQGEHSPEGEAFVLEMYAAWRDWAAVGSPGQNGAAAQGTGLAAIVAALCAAFLLGC
ncbi:glycosyl hydrolase family 88-domain-containing protein [Dichomitus squalens]|uniref:Glycosyl hydrolase family 88-domain-containing protein n=1 Tax=Dichomitus squalens TaxID=114155 RepID=A0A4Q9P928_9APHY|nr:glycosyl hydrolase family 88-domain-containing protein [Dichomitus squalens]TBU51109.1 glycosyl hydrolase family 88-domain-containing protein [Dichomitus squalens]